MPSLGEHREISNHGFWFSENVTCLCPSFHRQEHFTAGQFSSISTLGPHPSRVSVLGLPYRSRCIEGYGEAWLSPAHSKSSRPTSLHVLHPSCRGIRKRGVVRLVHNGYRYHSPWKTKLPCSTSHPKSSFFFANSVKIMTFWLIMLVFSLSPFEESYDKQC